jgi:hypothetical protein
MPSQCQEQTLGTSVYHFVGKLLELQGYVEAQCFRGLEVDDQFEPRRNMPSTLLIAASELVE